jgi:GT2 family glycosyltransferase
MSRQKSSYDWAAYYAAAYKREHKNNVILAGKIADAERQQADYDDNLERICKSPFWKMTSPARKLYHELKKGAGTRSGNGRCSESDACLIHYREELEKQKNPYKEWINNRCYKKEGSSVDKPSVSVQDFLEMRIPDTDVTILAYGEGQLSSDEIGKIKSYFNNNRSCLVAYGDEDFYAKDMTDRMQPWFKPCYSPDTLLAFQYWGHLIAVRQELLTEVAFRGMPEEQSPDIAFYDLCLRLEEAVIRRADLDVTGVREMICHIDEVLYHRHYSGENLQADLDAGKYLIGASQEFLPIKTAVLRRRGIQGEFRCGADPDLYHIMYDTSVSGRERCARAGSAVGAITPHRLVSVVIPSRDHPEVLAKCLETFRRKTSYPYYEWIVVDNGSSEENKKKMEELQREYGFSYLYAPMPFNFSKMCNLGVERAKGDLILLLNDDMEIIEESWLERMAGQALQPHVGAVGAKLWYAGTESIQHVGITNLPIGPSHKLITFADDRDYYYGRNRVTYDVIGVTGACLMVTREKYREVGGLDEEMAVAYNDVDFCFKLLEAGYFNVQRNDVVLYHHESLSRGLDEDEEGKWDRLLQEKAALYAKHPNMDGFDPFYHKDLVDNASDYRCNFKFPYEEHLLTVEVSEMDHSLVRRAKEGRLQLTVDRAEQQHKIHQDEEDILWIMGWSYVPGADNAAYERLLLLQREDGVGVTAVPCEWHREDVEAILPAEFNVGLAGFVVRIRQEDIPSGQWKIGMLCRGIAAENKGCKWLAWSDKTVTIS